MISVVRFRNKTLTLEIKSFKLKRGNCHRYTTGVILREMVPVVITDPS